MKVSVIVPTLDAGPGLPRLIERLATQTRPPAEVLVIDSSSDDGSADAARAGGCRVLVIPRESFDHGRTRNLAAARAIGDTLVFLTQDSLPGDDAFLERLTRPIREGRAVAAYARQEARPDSRPTERAARRINYPDQGHLKTLADLPAMGIRAFFFSNAASAVSRQAFERIGRFPEGTVSNEDMLLCARLLRAGATVAYEAEAWVLHSHDLSLARLLGRYYDIGVFLAEAGPEMDAPPCGRAGLRFFRDQCAWLARHGELSSIPRAIAETATKWLGFRIGRSHRLLPPPARRLLSCNRNHWRRAIDEPAIRPIPEPGR